MHALISVPNGPRQKPSLCRLRQKKKILRSDNLSIEKDFPRFYAKCRNRRSCDGDSDSETESSGSRSMSPFSSEEEFSTVKQRLCRLSDTDPMRDLLNDKHRLNSLTVEIHKLNRSYNQTIDLNNNSIVNEDEQKRSKCQNIEVESPPSPPNTATCISINWDECLTPTKFGKLKSRLSQVSLSDSGYASNPDLTESTELLETKDETCKDECGSPPCEVYCGFGSTNYGEFSVSHQPEKVVIQILPHDQDMPEIQKRPLSRCTIKINSGERLNEGFDYFSEECIQTLDQCIQTEYGSPNSVCFRNMQSSEHLDCTSCDSPVQEKKFPELFTISSAPLQVQSCPELSSSSSPTEHLRAQVQSLDQLPTHKRISRVTFTPESNHDLEELLSYKRADESSEETNRLSELDVFLVQDSWLMVAEGEDDRPTSGKVPYVIFSHRKTGEPSGRWSLMQKVLSENRKLRMQSLPVQTN